MRIFKNKAFYRWAKEIDLPDKALKEAVNEINNGLFEANLGGNIFKKRIALHGRGKSAGVRTIIAFKAGKHVFFIHGYAKNVLSTISDNEEVALKKLSKFYFSLSDEQLAQAIHAGKLMEV